MKGAAEAIVAKPPVPFFISADVNDTARSSARPTALTRSWLSASSALSLSYSISPAETTLAMCDFLNFRAASRAPEKLLSLRFFTKTGRNFKDSSRAAL